MPMSRRETMRQLGTQYRWTKAQKNRSGLGHTVDYQTIAERYLKNGVLDLCFNCTQSCKIAQPVLLVRFYCSDYIKAGGKQPLKTLRKDSVASPAAVNAFLPPSFKRRLVFQKK